MNWLSNLFSLRSGNSKINLLYQQNQKNHHLLIEILEILAKISPNNIIEENSSPQFSSLFVPPGHFYSPIPSQEDIEILKSKQFSEQKSRVTEIAGIDLKTNQQLGLLDSLKSLYQDLPFSPDKQEKLRFFYENPAYSYSDSIFLYFMIRYFQPRQIIEVGSGYSSCVMLDVNELYFNNSIKTTFIEPYPDLLISLIKQEDKYGIDIRSQKLQEISLDIFLSLDENDILFIDSTHILKFNSDVNYILSSILPSLRKGVLIHFHDIFYPFEYPQSWILENRAWNEIYALRSFLQYNDSFEIIMFNTYLEDLYPNFFQESMPLCLKNPGGSIWIRKVK